MSGANSKSVGGFNPLNIPIKNPLQALRDLDNRPEPDHTAENAAQRAKDQAAFDADQNVTGNTPKTAQFATRDQVASTRAAAAGAQRSDNEADLLGYTTTPVKKRSASRMLLG